MLFGYDYTNVKVIELMVPLTTLWERKLDIIFRLPKN